MGIEREDKKARDEFWARNYEFFGAPVELFLFTHKSLGKFAASDAGLFMQNLMLSAHSKGLGTCAQGAVAVPPRTLHKYLYAGVRGQPYRIPESEWTGVAQLPTEKFVDMRGISVPRSRIYNKN